MAGALKRITTAEGEALPMGEKGFAYQYFLKDHLGNVRAVIRDDNTGSPEVIQAKTYYPCGMVFTSEMMQGTFADKTNPYLFNGKEQQEMPGLWYDYGARMYDAQLARFHTIDPLAEKYSYQTPFAYAANNPIRFIDLMGMSADGYTIDEENGTIQKVDDTGGKNYDVLYTKKDYEEAKESGESNSEGNPEPSKQVKVKDISILPQLADETNVGEGTTYLGDKVSGPVANTNSRSDAYNVFKFSAENSNVEWSYQRYTDGTASVATANENSSTFSGTHHKSNKGKTVAADVHSHPGTGRGALEPSDSDMRKMRSFIRKNSKTKVQLYMPKAPNPNARMLDLVNWEWITNY